MKKVSYHHWVRRQTDAKQPIPTHTHPDALAVKLVKHYTLKLVKIINKHPVYFKIWINNKECLKKANLIDIPLSSFSWFYVNRNTFHWNRISPTCLFYILSSGIYNIGRFRRSVAQAIFKLDYPTHPSTIPVCRLRIIDVSSQYEYFPRSEKYREWIEWNRLIVVLIGKLTPVYHQDSLWFSYGVHLCFREIGIYRILIQQQYANRYSKTRLYNTDGAGSSWASSQV